MQRKSLYIAAGIVGVVAVIGIVLANQKSCDAQSCQAQASVASQEAKPEINKIKDELSSGALLVDVRTPEEYAESHAQRAMNLPYEQIENGTYPTSDKDAKIYVYCRSGKRAESALSALKNAGYENATSLVSLDNWQKLGGAVESTVQ